MELTTTHGIAVSAWTVRRWLPAMDGVWKRAQLVAKDDAPQRVDRWARMRFHAEPWQAHEVMVLADELDLHLWPKGGAAWMPTWSQLEGMTPGQNAKHDRAGALNLATGEIRHGRSARKTHALFPDLLTLLDHVYPASRITRIAVVVDHYGIHQATAVGQGIESQPRIGRRWWPTHGPQANPIERAFGDVHDQCTRTHQRKRLREVVSDGERHLRQNGPWLYKLSQIYDAPEVTAAVEHIAAVERVKIAA